MTGNRLIYALARLSDRERALLLVLGAVFVPLALVFFAVLPMMQARDAARDAAAEAEAVRNWVADQVRLLPAEGQATGTPGVLAAPIGISAIEQSLLRAGLRDRVADLSNRSGGGVDLAFDAVEFQGLAAWLQDITPDWGYRIAAFRFEQGAGPGLVRASFELEGLQ